MCVCRETVRFTAACVVCLRVALANRELVIEHGPFFHGGISTTECFFVKKELFDDL